MPENNLEVNFKTREEWLTAAVTRHFAPLFEAHENPLPTVRVSTGFPVKGAFGKVQVLSQCWRKAAAEDGISQIYISPVLSDPVKVLDVLGHELVHAALPDGTAHKKPFKQLCERIGWTVGPAKSQTAGDEARAGLEKLVADILGAYPHAAVRKNVSGGEAKPQTCRQLKIRCTSVDHEEYILRGSRKTFSQGLPKCPICDTQMAPDGWDEESEPGGGE